MNIFVTLYVENLLVVFHSDQVSLPKCAYDCVCRNSVSPEVNQISSA